MAACGVVVEDLLKGRKSTVVHIWSSKGDVAEADLAKLTVIVCIIGDCAEAEVGEIGKVANRIEAVVAEVVAGKGSKIAGYIVAVATFGIFRYSAAATVANKKVEAALLFFSKILKGLPLGGIVLRGGRVERLFSA